MANVNTDSFYDILKGNGVHIHGIHDRMRKQLSSRKRRPRLSLVLKSIKDNASV